MLNTPKAISASENKFRALVEQSITGIYIFRKESFLYVNNRFCEIFGYSQQEILSDLKPTDVIMSEDREKAEANIEKRLGGKVDSIHYFARGNHKHAKELWVEIHGTHIMLDGEDVITGTVLDITERRQASLALGESEARYRSLFEHAPDGILIANPEGYYVNANAGACRMLDYSQAELIGLHVSDILVQGEDAQIDVARREIKAEPDDDRAWQLRRKDGSVFSAEVIETTLPDGNLMGIVRDITERRQAEEWAHKEAERTQALLRVSDQIYRLRDFKAVQNALCEETMLALQVPSVLLYLVDPDLNAIQIQAAVGIPPHILPRMQPIPLAVCPLEAC